MLKITGYSDKISTKPGDDIHFYIHCDEKKYNAQLVKLRCGDMNPDGPGFKETIISSDINKSYPGRKQEIYAGSFAVIAIDNSALKSFQEISNNFSLELYIYPTLLKNAAQTIADFQDNKGFRLFINENSKIEINIGSGSSLVRVHTNKSLCIHVWYKISLSFENGLLTLNQEALDHYHEYLNERKQVTYDSKDIFPEHARPLLFAGRLFRVDPKRIIATDIFNGKIENPTIKLCKDLHGKEQGGFFCRWDFSKKIPTTQIIDVGPLKLHGYLENLPTRGVTSHQYTGEETSWVHKPEHYAAIHFHDDDLYDAKWEKEFSLKITDNYKSGIYAIKLSISDQDEYIPFVITPGKKKNKIALLFPTATYMAYANEHITMDPPIGELICQRAMQFTPYQLFLNEHREYGNSLYDVHSDGSGVHYSSRLRPILNMRPKRLFTIGAGSSFLWQFNADTHITDWLEAMSFEYDVITDEDLETHGVNAIKDHQVIITTTHPEYYSSNMMNALDSFLRASGRLMYMGGNGFYWKIAFHQSLAGVIEVRRISGTRAWETSPGEGVHSFTGEAGGLWRHNSYSPNKLVGVGFAAQGFDRSSYYRRAEDANNPRASFIFKNVNDEIMGDFGLIGHGAAGMEIDRFDVNLGSPQHALVLASSEEHSAAHLVAVEDIYNNYLGTDGEQNALVRADMVFFETPSGGAVFSTGSIAWSGALSHDNYQNNISKITYNVLARFVDPTSFTYPCGSEYEEIFDNENLKQ